MGYCITVRTNRCGLHNRPFSQALVIAGMAQVSHTTLLMALFYSSVPRRHDSVTGSQRAQPRRYALSAVTCHDEYEMLLKMCTCENALFTHLNKLHHFIQKYNKEK